MASPFQILVVGVGALGCEILSKLALAGFDRLDIVDFDVVEGSNLCRQFLFTAHDVGRPHAALVRRAAVRPDGRPGLTGRGRPGPAAGHRSAWSTVRVPPELGPVLEPDSPPPSPPEALGRQAGRPQHGRRPRCDYRAYERNPRPVLRPR